MNTVIEVNDVSQTLVWIPAGEFLMGSPKTEARRWPYEEQHLVTLTQGFWLADTACTQALWRAVMGDNPSRCQGDERPVENVSWDQVQEFIERLNGLTPGGGFRLPTEAEWEYAARAGTTTPFWFGAQITPEQANYDGNHPYTGGPKGKYRGETVEVKALPCNDWGLHQMHGNVWEWCQDWYDAYSSVRQHDPSGPESGYDRVVRGGGWYSPAGNCRSACRDGFDPGLRDGDLGFRLARSERNPLFVGAIDRPADAPMATPAPGIHQPAPAVIVLRPAWLDTPTARLLPRLLALMLIFAPGVAFLALITRLIWRAF